MLYLGDGVLGFDAVVLKIGAAARIITGWRQFATWARLAVGETYVVCIRELSDGRYVIKLFLCPGPVA